MKKIVLILIMMIAFISYPQKKTNGTVYIEHPAINVVNSFIKATIAGDKAQMASYLTDDFKYYSGTSNRPNNQGLDKEAFLNNQLRYHNELDYFDIEPISGSYPDAIEYKKDNKDKEVWVQTWDYVKGVHKATGVKIDAAAHRLYVVTNDNKIKTIINYSNSHVLDEIGDSFVSRTNGTIYDHHDNINTVRKAMYAFERGDLDKSLSYYSDDAQFYDINDPFETPAKTKSEIRSAWQGFLDNFKVENIEMFGYPDYLEYERDNGREALSWWKLHLIRKSDNKKITLFMHISNSFNSDGQIANEIVYYGGGLLTK